MAGMNPFGGLGGGSKEGSSGVAPSKKTAKASKLARMTEEEKVIMIMYIMNEIKSSVM